MKTSEVKDNLIFSDIFDIIKLRKVLFEKYRHNELNIDQYFAKLDMIKYNKIRLDVYKKFWKLYEIEQDCVDDRIRYRIKNIFMQNGIIYVKYNGFSIISKKYTVTNNYIDIRDFFKLLDFHNVRLLKIKI